MADTRAFDGIPSFASTDASAPVDGLLRQAQEAAAVRAELNQTVGEASTDDGFIKAVVGARGLQSLTLDPRAMRMPSEDLSTAIIEVTSAAREDLDRARIARARELGLGDDAPNLDDSLARLSQLKSLVEQSQGDARRVFERFQAQTER